MIEGIVEMGVLTATCDAHLCVNEVTSARGAVVFPTENAIVETARATGWWVETRDNVIRLYCVNHTRHRYGRSVGPLATKAGRDLGHRWEDA